MASSHFLLPSAITHLVLLFITCFSPNIHSQNVGNSPTGPTVAECGPRLLSLAPCSAFVQGTASLPAQPCCDNLRQLYNQEFSCLCVVMNDPTLTVVPVNRTLALQLPVLCSLHADISTCSGVAAPLPPSTPASQVSFGTKSNSTVAASPTVTVAPKSSMMGLIPHGSGAKLNAASLLMVAFLTAMLEGIQCF